MDNPTRVCVCYVITALLITVFVYSLVFTHFSSITKIERLQFEVEEIGKVLLGRNPGETLLPQIDSYVKKRTQGLWDELVAVKKRLESIDIGSSCGIYKQTQQNLQVITQEEPNFALESFGATIEHVEDDPYHFVNLLESIFIGRYKSNFPRYILDPSMQLGSCYAFKGDKSVFTIKLSHEIYIRSITVEHIPASVSLNGDISNAPKDFIVYGVADMKAKADTLLGSFQYNNSLSQRAQTFYLDNENRYQYCKIKVMSNYGNPNQTCIYRVAVHGKL